MVRPHRWGIVLSVCLAAVASGLQPRAKGSLLPARAAAARRSPLVRCASGKSRRSARRAARRSGAKAKEDPALPEYSDYEMGQQPTEAAADLDGGSPLDRIISKEDNPYLTSRADRLRARYGDAVVTGSGDSRQVVEDRLAADLEQFRVDTGAGAEPTRREDEELSLIDKTIDVLGTVLTYNFFIIIAFFAWFLAGVGMQYGAQNTVLIGAFQGAWDVLILPLLTTHMTLTFLSAGLEKIAGRASG